MHTLPTPDRGLAHSASIEPIEAEDTVIVLAGVPAIEFRAVYFPFAAINSPSQRAEIFLASKQDALVYSLCLQLSHVSDAKEKGKVRVKKGSVRLPRNGSKNTFQLATMAAAFANPFAEPAPLGWVGSVRGLVTGPLAVELGAAVEDGRQHM
jgi:hypothetical protein